MVRPFRTASRVLCAGALAVAAVATTAGTTYALGEYHLWNSSKLPQRVTGYGSTGYAYGKWRVYAGSAGTASQVYSFSRLALNADNHKVYVKLTTQGNSGLCFQPEYTSCTQKWFVGRNAETTHHSSKTYKYYKAQTKVDPGGDYSRGWIQTCLDIPWRTDPCNNGTFTSGSKY